MGYAPDVYAKAEEILRQRREKMVADREKHRAICFSQRPELAEIHGQMISAGSRIVQVTLGGGDITAQIDKLAEGHDALIRKRSAILRELGYPEDYLNPPPVCPICEDSGYTEHDRCECMSKILRDLSSEAFNRSSPMQLQSFDTINLNYYSDQPDPLLGGVIPRRKMTEIFKALQRYAANFSLKSHSLLMWGGPGLGKTHLALAVASKVISKGYSVIYSPAQQLISKLEREHFSSGNKDTEEAAVLDCDLLIMDDLGTEFLNPYTHTALYSVINTRVIASRPTIISTNLSYSEMRNRYPERLVSRIIGCYVDLRFTGDDIRKKKRLSEMKGEDE